MNDRIQSEFISCRELLNSCKASIVEKTGTDSVVIPPVQVYIHTSNNDIDGRSTFSSLVVLIGPNDQIIRDTVGNFGLMIQFYAFEGDKTIDTQIRIYEQNFTTRIDQDIARGVIKSPTFDQCRQFLKAKLAVMVNPLSSHMLKYVNEIKANSPADQQAAIKPATIVGQINKMIINPLYACIQYCDIKTDDDPEVKFFNLL